MIASEMSADKRINLSAISIDSLQVEVIEYRYLSK